MDIEETERKRKERKMVPLEGNRERKCV